MSAEAVSESPEYVLNCIDRILPGIAEDPTSPGVLSQVGRWMMMIKLSLDYCLLSVVLCAMA